MESLRFQSWEAMAVYGITNAPKIGLDTKKPIRLQRDLNDVRGHRVAQKESQSAKAAAFEDAVFELADHDSG